MCPHMRKLQFISETFPPYYTQQRIRRFLSGDGNGITARQTVQQARQVNGPDDFQKFIRSISGTTNDTYRRIVKSNPFFLTEKTN